MIDFNFFLFIFFIILCFAGVLVRKTNDHAEEKHDRTDEIRKKYGSCGSIEIWQEKKNKKVFHLIVLLDDGVYGDWIVSKSQNGKIFEKTAFVPKDGTLKSIHTWLKPKAIRYFGEL